MEHTMTTRRYASVIRLKPEREKEYREPRSGVAAPMEELFHLD
jgi:L-rhamnose mutarotase